MSGEAFGDIRLFGFQFDEASSVVADFATTQCLKNPTVANFAIVELVALRQVWTMGVESGRKREGGGMKRDCIVISGQQAQVVAIPIRFY